jgi:hypothetical protein
LFNSSKTSWAHVTLIGCSPSPAVSLTIVLIEPFLKSLSQQTYNNSGLLEHMRTVKEKTGQDWENDLNASFTATQMVPYAIEALNKGDN